MYFSSISASAVKVLVIFALIIGCKYFIIDFSKSGAFLEP